MANREVYWTLGAVRDGKIDHMRCFTKDRESAIQLFKEQKKLDPEFIDGPAYPAKGLMKKAKERVGVEVDAVSMLASTGMQVSGIIKNWRIKAAGLCATRSKDGRDFKDNELFHAIFVEPVDPDNRTRKPSLLANEAIRMSDIENLEEIS